MFYSHEILTSPEHGVATIWLVATLGSRSISRRLNRKTILDVDVPKACDVIMDPVAPMALRLQGNLLYGVSRVYSQQCGYTLTDVQAMHDRMRAMLRSMPERGLDPAAGKARPDQLILPYDPSFLPENNLPGLGMDLSRLTLPIEEDPSQQSSVFWPQTPDLSQSALTSTPSLQLNLPSEDTIMRDIGGFGSETDIASSVQRSLNFGGLPGLATSGFNEDEGVLLQPDFEFDEDGNIIELGGHRNNEEKTKRHFSESREVKESEVNEFFIEDQPMLVDEDINTIFPSEHQSRMSTHPQTPKPNRSSIFDPEAAATPDEVIMRQRQRVPKIIPSDEYTALRNSELAGMNNEYVRNMTTILKQKRHNKTTTQAKKNAFHWVFGLGIGAVGTGVGSSRVMHPLCCFSGHDLFDTVKAIKQAGQKRPLEAEDGEGADRRVRAKGENEDRDRQQDHVDDGIYEDVEIGRHAPPALRDDTPSQMPWNITASVQSSRHESSAANIFRGLGDLSDFSSYGMPGSAASQGIHPTQPARFGRARSRLTSVSPLARRGFPYDLESIHSLAIPVNENDDVANLEGFELEQHLNTDAVNDNPLAEASSAPTYRSQLALQNSLTEFVMDEESLNFLDFVATKMNSLQNEEDNSWDNDTTTNPKGANEITFSTLLPPRTTSRKVATQGLMHTLALTTKGFLSVHQDAYEDQSTEEHGVRYKYGEIFLRLSRT